MQVCISLLHIRQIRVTAGKYQGKCIQLWRVVDVVDNWGTLAEMVWMGRFWLWSQIMWSQAVAVLPYASYATKWHVARCLAVQKALTEAIHLDFCRLISTIFRVEDLFLRKKVPWQIFVLIEDHKCMEVGEH